MGALRRIARLVARKLGIRAVGAKPARVECERRFARRATGIELVEPLLEPARE
jgi:hypothetical protein